MSHYLPTNDVSAINIACSSDGRGVVAACKTGAIIWDGKSFAEDALLSGHEGDVTAVAFSEDGRYIVTGGADCTIRCVIFS